MQPEDQSYYAITKLSEAARVIVQAIEEMPEIRTKIDKLILVNKKRAKEHFEDLQKLHARLIQSLTQSSLLLLEMNESSLAEYTLKLISSIENYNLMTPDYSILCNVLKEYLSQLPEKNQTTNARIVGRLMNRVRMGYYPTDLEHIKHFSRSIKFPKDVTTNLFDPCCGCGLALRALAEGNNCFAYGTELDEFRAEEALTRLHRVGIGSFFHSRISHEAFHAMLLNPPYLSVLSKEGQNFRSEKRFLVDSICHLMIGGLLIYIIPYYRLTEDICKVLSDNYSDISAWKFCSDEFNKFSQIAIMGIRKKREANEEEANRLSMLAFQIDNMPELNSIPDGRYVLPNEAKQIGVFKGSEFNVAELAHQLKNSDSFSKLFQKSKLDDRNKRPLLPLSIGQVGLIGGSGLINGLVDCEAPHVIKGKIVKVSNEREEESVNSKGKSSRTIHEVVSNKMIFNILTPQGFKSLS